MSATKSIALIKKTAIKYSSKRLITWTRQAFVAVEQQLDSTGSLSVTVAKRARRLARAEGLNVVLVGAKLGQELNQKFRHKNYPTDILSFAEEDSGDGEASLGELVICAEVLTRQAVEHGHSWKLEFQYLVIHGVLHLLGFSHESGGLGAKLMYQIQDAAFFRVANRNIRQ